MSPSPAFRFMFPLKVIGLFGRTMAANLMDDFPPPPDRLVTLANWRQAPFSAWSFRNVRRLVPTADIAASGLAIPLETGLEDLSHVGFTGHDGKPTTLGHAL